MIFPSTEVKRLVIFAAARGSSAEVVAAVREEIGVRILNRRTVPLKELSALLNNARAHGVEVVVEEVVEPLSIAAATKEAEIPAAPARFAVPVSIFSPFSLDLFLATQPTRAPNF